MKLRFRRRGSHDVNGRSHGAEQKLKTILSRRDNGQLESPSIRSFFNRAPKSTVAVNSSALGEAATGTLCPPRPNWDQFNFLDVDSTPDEERPSINRTSWMTISSNSSASSTPNSSLIDLTQQTRSAMPNISHLLLIDTTGTEYQRSSIADRSSESGFQTEQEILLSRIQEFASRATKECLRVKEILQWYDSEEYVAQVSQPDLQELLQIFTGMYEPIHDFHDIFKELDPYLGKHFETLRDEWTIARMEIVLVRSGSISPIPGPNLPDDGSLRTSNLNFIIEKLLKILHRAPMRLILPHIQIPGIHELTTLTYTQMPNGTVALRPTSTAQKLFRISSTLRDDVLNSLSDQSIAGAICGDICHFSILAERSLQKPFSIRWTAAAAPGAISEGSLTAKHIRNHVSEKLKIPPYNFELWVRGTKLEAGEELQTLYSWTHNVITIALDPVLDVVVNGTGFVSVDFSEALVNKAFVPIRVIKEKVRSLLQAEEEKPLTLFLANEELNDDSLSLRDTGRLGLRQAEGFEQIHLKAKYNIAKKTCMTCMEDKYASRFPDLITESCAHDYNVCKTCLRHWIDEQLNSNGTNIHCPECSQAMGYEDVKRCTRRRQFERYAMVFVIFMRQVLTSHIATIIYH
jgi:hypothetical protein